MDISQLKEEEQMDLDIILYFLVKNTNKTLAEMDDLERLSINHRSKAIENLKQILEEIK